MIDNNVKWLMRKSPLVRVGISIYGAFINQTLDYTLPLVAPATFTRYRADCFAKVHIQRTGLLNTERKVANSKVTSSCRDEASFHRLSARHNLNVLANVKGKLPLVLERVFYLRSPVIKWTIGFLYRYRIWP